jgi:hypothetical protein
VKPAASEPSLDVPGGAADARRQARLFVAIALALFAALRVVVGPLPQDPAYHLFVDTRSWGPIPRAGDVLTNAAILAAGLTGLALRRRVHIAADERPVYALFVLSLLATAAGSAWYHAAPSDARLVWDRLPMTLVIAAILTFVLADRLHPAFASAWRTFAALGAASVLWWAWTDRGGDGGDLMLYVVVRGGAGLAILFLLLLRRGRHSHAGWLVAAIVLDIVMTACELLDREIFAATRGLVSGHSMKHLLAGALLGCILAWLVRRERRIAGQENKARESTSEKRRTPDERP